MKKKCFIFDIDGTLADNGHRQMWVKNKPKNWVAYNKTMSEDTIIKPVAEILELIEAAGYIVYICSGREEIYRDITQKWLYKNSINYDGLYMRKEKDYRDDTIVKEEMLHEIQQFYDVVAVFDDRHKVVDMWRKNGCFVFDCNQERSIF